MGQLPQRLKLRTHEGARVMPAPGEAQRQVSLLGAYVVRTKQVALPTMREEVE